jgi:hypothetical protein
MSRLIPFLLAACLGLTGAGCTGCATALLEGILVADGQGGLAVQADGGNIIPVQWPDGVGIGHDGDKLTLTNPLGLATAHEGEFVSMAGGVPGDSPEFAACGPIAVRASGPPTQ